MDCKLKIKMVTSVDPKRGSCVFSRGGAGFRIAQCPQVKYSCEREFCPLQAVGPGGIMMKKESVMYLHKDVTKGVKHL